MKVVITAETGNDDCRTEHDLILHLLSTLRRAQRTGLGRVSVVLDGNGNPIGSVEVTP
jgi:hypothetical protein